MEVSFRISKEERKELVAAVSEITGCASQYQGPPSFGYAVGDYLIDRNGVLHYSAQASSELDSSSS